jgi:hypothetical protein
MSWYRYYLLFSIVGTTGNSHRLIVQDVIRYIGYSNILYYGAEVVLLRSNNCCHEIMHGKNWNEENRETWFDCSGR